MYKYASTMQASGFGEDINVHPIVRTSMKSRMRKKEILENSREKMHSPSRKFADSSDEGEPLEKIM